MESTNSFSFRNIALWTFSWLAGGVLIDWSFTNAGVYSFGIGSLITFSIFAFVLGTSGPYPLLILLLNNLQAKNNIEAIFITFDINKTFGEWVKGFDNEFKSNQAEEIKLIFRGVSKENPKKVIAIFQARSNVLKSFISNKGSMNNKYKGIFNITNIKTYLPNE